MISRQELRIGNVVEYKDQNNKPTFARVIFLHNDIAVLMNSDLTTCEVLYNHLFPIKITTNILRICKFEPTEKINQTRKYFSRNTVHLYIDLDKPEQGENAEVEYAQFYKDPISRSSSINDKIAKNLHELQNAYYEFTNEELNYEF